MLEPVTVPEVLKAILAGEREWKVAFKLRQLAPYDRQNVLCTVCAMRDEIARKCLAAPVEVKALLTTGCPLYVHGTAT